jgi:hypothetical protein
VPHALRMRIRLVRLWMLIPNRSGIDAESIRAWYWREAYTSRAGSTVAGHARPWVGGVCERGTPVGLCHDRLEAAA